MLGTVVNALAIVFGSFVGLFIRGGMKPRFQEILMSVMGLSIVFIGASTALGGMLNESSKAVLYIVSLAIGSLIGETLKIEERLEKFGDFIESATKSKGGNISQGFVTASLTFCVGTMAVIGSIESGVQGVNTTLFTKAVIDGTMALVMASSMGIGVMLSAAAVFVYQGILTLGASLVQPYLTEEMLVEMSIVGGILISAIGINTLEIKKFKVGNMLPAIAIPVIYYLPPVSAFFGRIYDFIK